MDLRVLILCFVAVCGKSSEYGPYYRPNARLEYRDNRGQASNVKSGFVQPLDFSTFTQQFVGEEKSGQDVPFGLIKTPPAFGAESKKSGAFQIPSSEFSPFQGPIFQKDDNKTGFVQPVQFASSFNKGANTKHYKTDINPTYKTTESNPNDQIPKATEEEDGDDDTYFRPSKVQSHQRRAKPKKPYIYGKSSYPSTPRRSNPSDYYSGLISKPKDVEMILPKDKVLFLPMVNGKPKPYDGYRAAPELGYETFENAEAKESTEQREKRLNEGEIIYGKPKIALSELYHRNSKRSPAEYYGGIYPYYDYSDAKLSVGGDTDPDEEVRGKKSSASNQSGKKVYPKKHRQRSKPYNPYKYSTDSGKRSNDEDTFGYSSEESSEEAEDYSEEEAEETKGDRPLYKYTYDDTVRVPPLEIKTYPYEKHLKDSHVEGSRRDESIEYDDNVDEYTAGYEKYIKTLPTDLESYFGSPEISDKFSVEATQNLENNKNCKKIDNPPKTEEGSEKNKNEGKAETQICYICSDPKTGDNYEQCAYRSQPKSEKYFFGGSTSFQTNETSEPATYRYRRSTELHPSLEEAESETDQYFRDQEDSEEGVEEVRKKPKKKYKKQTVFPPFYGKKQPKKRYKEHKVYDPFFKIHGASSSKRGRREKSDQPPRSYNGPKYTYEGPEETYEGPARTYEGPKETYEGPAEPYEGPINQEYYDTVDERIRDDEEEEEEEAPKQESQSSSPSKNRYYNKFKRQKPRKRQSYSSQFDRPHTPSRYYDEDYGESYRPRGGYTSDYRFGPEHFVDEGETEGAEQNQRIKPAAPAKTSEKRGPQKFSGSEARSTAATDKQEKEEPIGEVKVFENGDVCQKKRKEGMICMVCKNEKTAATYEQCQYSTKPKEKYYAYGSQKSYTTKNPNTERKDESEPESDSDQYPEKSDIIEKKILITTQSKVFGYDPVPTEGLAVAESNNSPHILPKDLYGDYTDNLETSQDDRNQSDASSRDFTESIERIEPRDGIEGLEEYLYDAEDSEKKATEDEKQSFKNYDDYFHDLFPEFGRSSARVPASDEKEESESETHLTFDPFSNVRKFHEENDRPGKYSAEEEEEEEEKDAEASRPEELRLKDKESRIPRDFFVPYNEEDHKKDLEKALGEFQSRDWSNCKKIVKKKLTCYQCVDKNGVNNEECMYVEASQPILKHLAYHEKKELKPASQEEKNQTIETTTEPEQTEKSLRRFRKAKNSPAELIDVAEPPKDAEYVEESPKKGDFEGVEKPPENTIKPSVSSDASETVGEQNTQKPKTKKNKRNPKKRNKTLRNETTTEKFVKFRKRKFPLKKFAETQEATTESKPDDGSFGLKSSESTPVTTAAIETETAD